MKKITAIFLTALLVLSLAFAGVNAETPTVVTVSDVEGDIGDTITVNISFSPAVELKTAGVEISYDHDALYFVGGTWNMENLAINNFKFQGFDGGAFAAMDDVTVGANCATLTFEILDAAVNGDDYAIGVSVTNAKNAVGDIITIDDSTGTEGDGTVSVHPSCTYGAWTELNDLQHVRSCAICGAEEVASHAWNQGVVTSAATCTEKGRKTYTCADCGATYTEEIAMIAHTGGKADCSHQAVCSVCSTPYGELDPSYHPVTKVIKSSAATVDAEGYTGDTVCADCGALISSGSVIEKLVNPSTADNSTAKIVCITVFGLALIGGACIAYKKERDF